MATQDVQRVRNCFTLLAYGLLGAAAPWVMVIGESQAGGDGLGVVCAVLAGVVTAVGLNLWCRRRRVHICGAAAVWAGWSLGGGVLICLIFSGFAAPDLWGSVLIAGWIGLWTVLPTTVVVNGVTTLLMQYARPRNGGSPRCGGCGYDLRGLPHSRCPECGTLDPRPASMHATNSRHPTANSQEPTP